MTGPPIIIRGVGPGGVHHRLEINDFIKNNKFFTLYIRALQTLQDTPEDQENSYFGIGGIHGEPYVSWNGAPGGESGYCAHGDVLFPMWHRPYTLLMEQFIRDEALKCAEKFTAHKDAWRTAAEKLRQPYWDWVKNIVPPDEVIAMSKVKIVDYDGKTKIDVDNPLLHYKFQGGQKKFSTLLPFSDSPTTLRHPKRDGNGYTHGIDELKRNLMLSKWKIRLDVVLMLTLVTDWDNFSNHGPMEGCRTNSLEGIHDQIHRLIGGHMDLPNYDAFDPIFYMHHANIDRLLSIWSFLHQGVRVPSDSAIKDLLPFRHGANTFWTSTMLDNGGYHATESLGYTYPYIPSFSGALPLVPYELQHAANIGSLQISPNPMLLHPYRAAAKAYTLEYLAVVKKFEVGGSFSILVFLGEIPESSRMFESDNLVGINCVFANKVPEKCENCRSDMDMIHEGFIHLNSSLAQHGLGVIITMSNPDDADDARNRLKEKLNYYVMDVEGNPVQLKYLDTAVIRTEVYDSFRHEREQFKKRYSKTRNILTSNIGGLFSALQGKDSVVNKVAQLFSPEHESHFDKATGHIFTTFKSASHHSAPEHITKENMDEVEENISRLLPRLGKTFFE